MSALSHIKTISDWLTTYILQFAANHIVIDEKVKNYIAKLPDLQITTTLKVNTFTQCNIV